MSQCEIKFDFIINEVLTNSTALDSYHNRSTALTMTYTDDTMGLWVPRGDEHADPEMVGSRDYWDLPPGILLNTRVPHHYEHHSEHLTNFYDLEVTAFPEDWDLEWIWGSKDMVIIHELMEAVIDGHYERIDQEMDSISNQLVLLERYQDSTAYYMYPMIHIGGGVLCLEDFTSFGIKEALHQFEEDWEYEKWINS